MHKIKLNQSNLCQCFEWTCSVSCLWWIQVLFCVISPDREDPLGSPWVHRGAGQPEPGCRQVELWHHTMGDLQRWGETFSNTWQLQGKWTKTCFCVWPHFNCTENRNVHFQARSLCLESAHKQAVFEMSRRKPCSTRTTTTSPHRSGLSWPIWLQAAWTTSPRSGQRSVPSSVTSTACSRQVGAHSDRQPAGPQLPWWCHNREYRSQQCWFSNVLADASSVTQCTDTSDVSQYPAGKRWSKTLC